MTVTIVAGGASASLWQWADVQSTVRRRHRPRRGLDGFSVPGRRPGHLGHASPPWSADGYLRARGATGPEFHVLALISAAGAMIMGEANDLVLVFLGLEILSIALYVLVAFNTGGWPRARRPSSTSCWAPSPRPSSSTGSPSSTGPPGRPT